MNTQDSSTPAAGFGAEQPNQVPPLLRLLFVFGLLYGFLVAIKMMGGGIAMLGKETSQGLFSGVSNPFAGLGLGVLATVLVQSSSTTTATIVGLVGSGVLTVKAAVPMIMGANIGTTVTNTLVSIGHVRKSQEFERALAAATVHDFFNLLCVALLLPLELMTGFLSNGATALTDVLTVSAGTSYKSPIKKAVKYVFNGVVGALESFGLSGTPLAVTVGLLGVALTFLCLVLITRNMRVMISTRLERVINNALGKGGWIGILIGVMVTVAVQSSSITTSLLVPMCAAGVLTLENAFPIMLGANIGTTVTALLASLAADSSAGLTIALVHTLFNLVGVLLFYPFPVVRRIPIRMARLLATKACRQPLWLFAYVVVVFILIPLGGWLLLR
ncbi:MAG: sodium-dependent phosphate cotransporter [Chlamydiales bacterium]